MTLRSFSALAGGQGTPEQPDWLSMYQDELDVRAAEQTWGIITREMREAGTLAVANRHAIRRLVDFRLQYDRSARQVAG